MKSKEAVFLFIAIVFCLIACDSSSKKTSNNKLKETILTKEDIEIAKIAMSFYEWYINYVSIDNNEPKIGLVKDTGDARKLSNVDKYMELLYSLNTLSPKFLKNESQRLANCDCFLKTFDWTKYENTYDFDDTPCGFFTYKYWFKSQEESHKVRVASLIKNNTNDTINVKLDFYFIDNAGEHKQYYSASEILIKSKGKWLIDDIKID